MPNYLPQEEEKERRKLYDQGLTDQEIAESLYLSKHAVYNWRRRRGLPANSTQGGKEYDHRRRLNYWRQGLVDKEIANRVGVTTGAISQWRWKHGLKANGVGGMDEKQLRQLRERII